ncbi:MAG: orotidine-5'-phosphate decarboxylase, partial [Gammaproteobacteria bacterium]
MSDPRIIVALDYAEEAQALDLAERIDPARCRLKIGKALFTRCGPQIVNRLQEMSFEVFLDLKFHDIPNTVERACRAAADLGVWMVNVHAVGGRRMLEAAKRGVDAAGTTVHLIAVTVLTSLEQDDLTETGIAATPAQQVQRLAQLSADSGLDGVVCSPRDLTSLRDGLPPGFLKVTPGIRPQGSAGDDQRRVLTPREALQSGASHLVIGRPITAAPDPLAALNAIAEEI